MKQKNDTKRQRAALLGMPYGTAEKHLRKAMLHSLALFCSIENSWTKGLDSFSERE